MTARDPFEELDQEFHFQTDVCALPENAQCPRFFSPEVDCLSQEWTGACFMNPPCGSQIGAWVSVQQNGATAVRVGVSLDVAR